MRSTTRTAVGAAGSLLLKGGAGWLGRHVKLVMLRSPNFGRVTASAGILAAILNWGLYVPRIGIFLSVLSVAPLAIWNVLIARRLFRLGRDVSEEVKLRRS